MYTRWKLAHGLIDKPTANSLLNYSRKDTSQEMMNRRSVKNKTNPDIILKHWNWLNESLSDLSDLMLPNVTGWNAGHTTPGGSFQPKEGNPKTFPDKEIDLATIFKLYEATLELASLKIKPGENMEQSVNKIIVENLISNQKQRLKDELSLLIEDEYFIIDRPYGVLVYSSGLDQHILIDEYLADFYVRTIKDIVETLKLTKKDFRQIGDIPTSIESRIFSSGHFRP